MATAKDRNSNFYFLDSAAHPTLLTTAYPKLTKLRRPISTSAATNDSSLCPNAHIVTIQPTSSDSIHLPALRNPALSQDLLSMRSFASIYGPLVFDRDIALITRRQTPTCSPGEIARATWIAEIQGYVVKHLRTGAKLEHLSKFLCLQTKPRATNTYLNAIPERDL